MTLCILCCEEVYKMSKGSEQRPTDLKRFNANWDAIFPDKSLIKTPDKEVRQAQSEPDVQEISSTCQKVLDR